MPNKLRVYRDREIRDIFNYLKHIRHHNSDFITSFIERNYFIDKMTIYKILGRIDENPVLTEQCSSVYKIVMSNEYHDL